jgi:hypothetical protein
MKKTVLHAYISKQPHKTSHEIPVIFGAAAKFALIVKYVYLLSHFLMLPITTKTLTVTLLVLFMKYY